MKGIIESALTTSMSADQYQSMLLDYAAKGKTSGQDQKEDLIHYTKLNAQRSKRINKTAVLNPSVISKAGSLTAQTWILITETWCGDAANSVPVIAKIAALNPKVNLRIVLRDENLELMDQFLTKSGRSIPKLVGLNPDLSVRFTWGPRPEKLQEIYWHWRESENRIPYSEFHVVIQKWYNDNKSADIQAELLQLL